MFIKAAGLIDVIEGRLIPDAYVAVQRGVVTAFGRRSDAPDPGPAALQLDFSDQYVLPGLINCHAHICKPAQGVPFYHRQTRDAALGLAVRNLEAEQASGVTTVRDCGDLEGVLLDRRLAKFEKPMPRLKLCGPPLTTAHGHAHFLGGVSVGSQGLRQAVGRWIEKGADFIKLIATGGGTPGTQPAFASYTTAELSAAKEAAHERGKTVSAHCRGIPGIENAVKARIDQIEHACFELPDGTLRFDAALAEKIAAAGIYVTPTIQLYRDMRSFLEGKLETAGLTAAEHTLLAGLPNTIEEKYRALQGFLKAGVRVVAGNDAGLPHTGFGCLWQELDAMVAGGMTTMQAIRAATLTAAQSLGLADRIGSIGVGRQADLLVVEEDPLADILALKSVRMVMQAGHLIFEKTVSRDRQ